MRRFRKYIREPYGMVLVTGPDRQRQDDDALRGAVGDQDGRGQDHHDRGSGRIPAPGHHADSDQREEGADVRARAAVDPAPRPRQDHGRRNPRPGDRADRHSVGAHRPPRVHDRPRQQRHRRARPLPEHGRRAVPVRVGAQLRAGAAARPADLRALQAAGDDHARSCSSNRRSTRRWPTTHTFYEGAGCIECGGTGFKGRTAICELMDLTDRIRDMILERRPDVGDQARGARRRHDVPAASAPSAACSTA